MKTFTCFPCGLTFDIRKPHSGIERLICPECHRPFCSGGLGNNRAFVAIEPDRLDEWVNSHFIRKGFAR